jgi:hypothetical protein
MVKRKQNVLETVTEILSELPMIRKLAPVKVSPPLSSPKAEKLSPPSMKKGKLRLSSGSETKDRYAIPEGIVAHLTRDCGENVHNHHVFDVVYLSFKKKTVGLNSHSGDSITGMTVLRRMHWC